MTTETVFKYLKVQNRPFSANDVATALEKEHNKSAVHKALEKLAENNRILMKVNGKQKVFCVIQDAKQSLNELKSMERELESQLNDKNRRLQELEAEFKTKEAALNSIKCSMTLEEAEKERDRLKEKILKLTTKLDELMESSGKQDLSEVKKKAEEDLKKYRQEFLKRKRMCNNVLDCILESYPGSKKQLYEEIGINEV